jgi:hypothetical protein
MRQHARVRERERERESEPRERGKLINYFSFVFFLLFPPHSSSRGREARKKNSLAEAERLAIIIGTIALST